MSSAYATRLSSAACDPASYIHLGPKDLSGYKPLFTFDEDGNPKTL